MPDSKATVINGSVPCDRFGHPLDPIAGYARGDIIDASVAETRRRRYALELIRQRARKMQANEFYNFTGLQRNYPVSAGRIAWAEEWKGPAFYSSDLDRMAKKHLGAGPGDHVAVFNRATGGIIASCLAIGRPGSVILSVVPAGRSHPSVSRGADLAQAEPTEVSTPSEVKDCLSKGNVSLVIITGVTSELAVIKKNFLLQTVRRAKKASVPTLLDDAYGARLRPLIFKQPKTLETGVDIGITSCDKAGLGGPRAGLMAGKPDLVDLVLSRAEELGLEARPPLSLGVYESLKNFNPENLIKEYELGKRICTRLRQRFGKSKVKRTGLGASISEEDAFEIVRSLQPSNGQLPVVPAEITAGIGMYWLSAYGMITVNALGQPGSRVSLRFKPDPDEIDRFGGISRLVEAVEDGFRMLASRAGSPEEMRKLILGSA